MKTFPPLPLRFTDALEIVVDPGVAGVRLSPAEALGLADDLVRRAVHRQFAERRRVRPAARRIVRATGEAA